MSSKSPARRQARIRWGIGFLKGILKFEAPKRLMLLLISPGHGDASDATKAKKDKTFDKTDEALLNKVIPGAK